VLVVVHICVPGWWCVTHLTFPVGGDFPQAEYYDESRVAMLHGRLPMMHALRFPAQRAVWVDLGAGTGKNLEEMMPYLANFRAIILVDLSPSLLQQAQRRV
jgi:hypothetical protein